MSIIRDRHINIIDIDVFIILILLWLGIKYKYIDMEHLNCYIKFVKSYCVY